MLDRARSTKRRPGWIKTTVMFVVVGAAAFLLYRTTPPAVYPVRCVVVGLDGLDPNLLRELAGQGLLPHLKQLMEEGDFKTLATSNPPQSPVAWSSFATGMNPGGTGIFDFVHRDPQNYRPKEAMSTARPAEPISIPWAGRYEPALEIGDHRIPLRSDQLSLNRQGKPFWEYLDAAGVPAVLLRLPANFPPPPGDSRQLAGMGTPDLTGTEGAFYFWTDRAIAAGESEGAGNVERVLVEDDRFTGKLYGPGNVLLSDPQKRGEPMTVEFEVAIDRRDRSACIQLQDQRAVLRAGDWSDWMSVSFVMSDYFPGNPSGMIRFRLSALEPNLELYGTPVQLDPLAPSMPISNPPDYADELGRRTGRFYTLGMPEDNKAFGHRAKALDETGFRQQCRQVLDDVWKTTELELERYRGGLFFTYFRTPDVVSHMMWYARDEKHPMYDEQTARLHGVAIQEAYQWVDEKVGEIHRRVGSDGLFLVMSDHGFAPFYREFLLNSWLADHGWLKLFDWTDRRAANLSDDVDWSATRAYAVGLNGLYVNVQGREGQGSVPAAQRAAVVRELCAALEKIVDPQTGERVVSHAYPREEAYRGAHLDAAPDIIVGYARGYRSSGRSGQGYIPAAAELEVDGTSVKTWVRPRKNRWSGDHCGDPRLVPGILIANRKITKDDPALTDLAPTILAEFGVPAPPQMIGAPVVAAKTKG